MFKTIYVATYIMCSDFPKIDSVMLQEEDETLQSSTYEGMYNLCVDDAKLYIRCSEEAEEEGYYIAKTDNGLNILDKDENIICIYNIHEVIIPIN